MEKLEHLKLIAASKNLFANVKENIFLIFNLFSGIVFNLGILCSPACCSSRMLTNSIQLLFEISFYDSNLGISM